MLCTRIQGKVTASPFQDLLLQIGEAMSNTVAVVKPHVGAVAEPEGRALEVAELQTPLRLKFNTLIGAIEIELGKAPDLPAVPQTPDLPEVPKTSDLPAVPKTSDLPAVPKTPDLPAVPKTSDLPAVPKTPDLPEVPKISDLPEIPKTSDLPAVPKTPDLPKARVLPVKITGEPLIEGTYYPVSLADLKQRPVEWFTTLIKYGVSECSIVGDTLFEHESKQFVMVHVQYRRGWMNLEPRPYWTIYPADCDISHRPYYHAVGEDYATFYDHPADVPRENWSQTFTHWKKMNPHGVWDEWMSFENTPKRGLDVTRVRPVRDLPFKITGEPAIDGTYYPVSLADIKQRQLEPKLEWVTKLRDRDGHIDGDTVFLHESKQIVMYQRKQNRFRESRWVIAGHRKECRTSTGHRSSTAYGCQFFNQVTKGAERAVESYSQNTISGLSETFEEPRNKEVLQQRQSGDGYIMDYCYGQRQAGLDGKPKDWCVEYAHPADVPRNQWYWYSEGQHLTKSEYYDYGKSINIHITRVTS